MEPRPAARGGTRAVPEEIWENVLGRLGARDTAAASAVARVFRRLTRGALACFDVRPCHSWTLAYAPPGSVDGPCAWRAEPRGGRAPVGPLRHARLEVDAGLYDEDDRRDLARALGLVVSRVVGELTLAVRSATDWDARDDLCLADVVYVARTRFHGKGLLRVRRIDDGGGPA